MLCCDSPNMQWHTNIEKYPETIDIDLQICCANCWQRFKFVDVYTECSPNEITDNTKLSFTLMPTSEEHRAETSVTYKGE